jgi:nicotinamide-nucleotide amidase
MDNQIHTLAERVGRLIARQKIMLVTAESCTGGWIAEAVTSVAGSSAWFERGFVSYSNQAKQDMLGVSADTLNRFGAVSEEVVLEMARGAVQRSKAHLSVAVSGIAGPDGGTLEKPVGTVWVAWGQKLGYAEAECFLFSGDRQAVREQTVIRALQGLIARLGG